MQLVMDIEDNGFSVDYYSIKIGFQGFISKENYSRLKSFFKLKKSSILVSNPHYVNYIFVSMKKWNRKSESIIVSGIKFFITGYKSFRHVIDGSWYLKCVAQIFMEHACHLTVQQMLDKVIYYTKLCYKLVIV